MAHETVASGLKNVPAPDGNTARDATFTGFASHSYGYCCFFAEQLVLSVQRFIVLQSFAMSRIFTGVFRSSRVLIPICSISVFGLNFTSRTRLDDSAANQQEEAIAAAKASIARKEEILKAAKEFVTFADNGPSGTFHLSSRVI